MISFEDFQAELNRIHVDMEARTNPMFKAVALPCVKYWRDCLTDLIEDAGEGGSVD